MTAPYSVGDKVSIEWRRKVWLDGEIIQHAMNNDAVCVLTTSGKRWVYPGQLKAPSTERRSLKLATPEVSEEADSFEAARERSTGSVKAELVAVPKPQTPRNEAFLEHLRTRPCDHCGRPPRSQPAHFGPDRGMGLKCSDYHACSLCWDCHNEEWHRCGRLPGLDRKESMRVQWRGAALAIVTFSFAMDADFWADLVRFLEQQVEGRRRA